MDMVHGKCLASLKHVGPVCEVLHDWTCQGAVYTSVFVAQLAGIQLVWGELLGICCLSFNPLCVTVLVKTPLVPYHRGSGLQKAYTVHYAIGAVLPIWKVLADTVIPTEEKKFKGDMDAPRGKDHARVVRLKLDSGEPIIGLSLMSDDVQKVSFSTWHDPARAHANTGWSVKHLDTSNIFSTPVAYALRYVHSRAVSAFTLPYAF